MKIRIKRIYDAPAKSDGTRILVDRLWPRGISKNKARLSAWMKEAAPSNELRQWYHNSPEVSWKIFRQKYREELRPLAKKLKIEFAKFEQPITLITSVKDLENSHASTLREFLN